MSTSENAGAMTADIGEDVIQDALRSVEAHERGDAPTAGEEAPPAEAPAADARELEELRLQLDLSQAKGRELMEKLRDTHERMLRSAADLDNYRKRATREKEETQKYGIERVLKDLLPVIDNLDRALEHTDPGADGGALLSGVKMTRKLFEDALGRNGVKAFSAKGQPFDPHLHEAMQQVESTDVPPNTVVNEVLRGYMLHERLVRPALVMVSRAPQVSSPPAEGSTQPEGEQS
ncbi:MAG: nucleotide exchange factor GrpE [Myxococcaceae bacterium]|nr:nucleotide exchange factor GrpE [Myxococcaceae bacterium]